MLTQEQVDAMGFDERVVRAGCRLGYRTGLLWDGLASSFYGERLHYLINFPNSSPTVPPTRLYCGIESDAIADYMGALTGLARNKDEDDNAYLGRSLPLSDAQ